MLGSHVFIVFHNIYKCEIRSSYVSDYILIVREIIHTHRDKTICEGLMSTHSQ